MTTQSSARSPSWPLAERLDAIVGGVARAHLDELHRAHLSVSSNVDGWHAPLPSDPTHPTLPAASEQQGYAARSVTYVQPTPDHAATAHDSPFWNLRPHGAPPALASSSYSGGTTGLTSSANPYAQSSTNGSNSPAAYAVVMGDGSIYVLPGPPAAHATTTTTSTLPGARAVETHQANPAPSTVGVTTSPQPTAHTYVAADVWLQVEPPAPPTQVAQPLGDDGGAALLAALLDLDPLLLDLNGTGVKLTSAHDGVMFDLNGDGAQEHVAWTQANGADTNAWLVRDDVHEGGQAGIQSGLELFGDQHGDANGFERLRQFDSNGDGVFDRSDAAFGDMQLWQDLNHDGVSQAGELASLADRGVTSIQLTSNQPQSQLADGTRILGSTYVRNA